MRRLLSLILVCSPLIATAATTPAGAVAELWQASSHAPGAVADVERLQQLFRKDAMVVGGIYHEGKPVFHAMKASDFIASQREPRPHGFYECEVRREVKEYDRFATVYSVVETRRDPKAAKADYTGVNSIQLYREEDGWKIVSLYYHVEKPGSPIPLEGARSGACLMAKG
ncbi:nuclear transport factor 2 family protein [Massilia sp. IC2-476]|uniref:nuclear transport factor 2 family protein n=1 Tax=Massilia sp. IC2-476 TaxID=2887199 RepID=UPI001D11A3E3|nr:nuclear transport factor 2 family protein [Massilia sp. IC2-476]MCC2974899.1 nuclear transport factor 2 family protein [Massilia sp. IC2-476]